MKRQIVAGALAVVAGAALFTAPASAFEPKNVKPAEAVKQLVKEAAATPSVHIGVNGEIVLTGATVTAVSGDTLNVKVLTGHLDVAWTITTNSSTTVVAGKATSSLADVKVGDTIVVRGTLSAWGSQPTVAAKQIVTKPAEKVDGPKASSTNATSTVKGDNRTTVAVGKIVSIDANAKTFVLQTKNGTTTVSVAGSTKLNLVGKDHGDKNVSAFSDLKANTSVMVRGSASGSVLTADQVNINVAAGLFNKVKNFLKISL